MISLLLLQACDGGQPVSTPPVESPPTEAPTPTEESDEATRSALLAIGVCAEDGSIQGVTKITLADGRTVLEVLCMMAAYQGAFEYAWPEGPARVTDQDGQPLTLSGLPVLDPASGTLTWLSKARGVGDCGDHFVYRLEGEHFTLQEHRTRTCDDPSPYVEPTEWALVSGQTGTGHCSATETAYFSCPTSKSRVLSLCGGDGMLQYRFGPVGAPELSYPADQRPSAFTVREEQYVRSMASIAAFTNGNVTYEVTDAIGGGGGPDAESNNFRGVYVFEDSKLIATVGCTEEPTTDWDGLRALVPEAP